MNHFATHRLFNLLSIILMMISPWERGRPARPLVTTPTVVSASIVISQVYGAGGNSGAAYRHDFVELFNRGTAAVNLNGWAIHYSSATGTSWQKTDLSGTVAPGQRYLIQQASGGANGVVLPAPDLTGTMAMASTAGKVVLTNTTAQIGGGTACPGGSTVIDLVGYGSSANCFEGAGPAPAPGSATAVVRGGGGCADTDQNNTDFATAAPAPRNTTSPAALCGASTNPSGTATASPEPSQAGGVVLLVVAVTPGANPASTEIKVTADLTAIGGGAARSLVDDGTNGDAKADDNQFSLRVELPASLGPGAKSVPITIADGQGRGEKLALGLTVLPPSPPGRVVMSQIFAGGGNSGAPFTHDFVELFNRGEEPVNLTGWSIQYATASGSSWSKADLSGTLAPGQYYLARLSSGGTSGDATPAPDATGNLNLSSSGGKIALVNHANPLATSCPLGENLMDLVGYGASANCFEGRGPAPAPGSAQALWRAGDGCLDANDNSRDWVAQAPRPRNTLATRQGCAEDETARVAAASDQSAASLLIFPFYSSISSNPRVENSRLTLTNTDSARAVTAHLFWIDGDSSAIADNLICLSPNQTVSLPASEFDPDVSGYLIAVAVDAQTGCPINFNHLLGEVYVKLVSGHAANLAAVGIPALAREPARCDGASSTAEIKMDGANYQTAPSVLAIDHLPSPVDGHQSLLVIDRIEGNLATGTRTIGQISGLIHDDLEAGFSFAFSSHRRQMRGILSNSFPRTVPRLTNIVPSGRSGWMRLAPEEGAAIVGALLTVNQGRNLHILTRTATARLTIPLLPAKC